ncbi:MAG TPA: CopG family antitoxin [Rhizobiaceae bacterium]|nr:CopG family antitoxin [Rhizobiaceae bacterium]
MNKTALKQFPVFHTDAEAEEFVATADLSEYDMSGFIPWDLAMNSPENEAYVLVPKDLVAAARAEAAARGVAFSEVVREALETSLRK